MHPAPRGRCQPDAKRPFLFLNRRFGPSRKHLDPVGTAVVLPRNLERVPGFRPGLTEELRQPGEAVFVPRAVRSVEPVVVVDKSNLHLLGSRLDGSTWCPIEPEKLGAALRPIFRDGDLRPSARQVPQRLKTATTSALASGRTQQLRVLDLALREARAEDCAAMQEDAALLHTLLLRDAETPVRNRFEAARRRRAQIPENSMRQVWEGQATALERQTRMAQLCAREEVEFLRRFREGLMKAPSLEPASIFLTFVDAEA